MADENQFSATAEDVAKYFGISEQAAYRLAREQRLPEGSFAYLNARTVRFNLGAVKRSIYEGGLAVPPKKKVA